MPFFTFFQGALQVYLPSISKNYEKAIESNSKFEKGVWYCAEPIFMMDHFDFCGIEDFPTTMEEFYFDLISVVNSNY